MMNWTTCISGQRFGTDHTQAFQRSEFERDWDRLIFASAFRRLQGKTQVFPLPEEIFVHNRLTHSLEVASVGRSLGASVGSVLAENPEIKRNTESVDFYQNHLKSVIAAGCLAHDLGNPAFGHSGESAISQYFIDRQNDSGFRSRFTEAQWADLTAYEGNANAFRILTRNFKGRTIGGFRLTYATLGAILKYPCPSNQVSGKSGPLSRKKYGFFQSDVAAFDEVTSQLGMLAEPDADYTFCRHPFVYLVEAADDICYNIIDFEDAHRLGVLPTGEVRKLFLDLLASSTEGNQNRIFQTSESLKNDPNELVAYLRAKCINFLTQQCSKVFLENQTLLLEGKFQGDLMGALAEARPVLNEISRVSVNQIYNHESVVKIELAGFRIMAGLIGDFVESGLNRPGERNKMNRKVLDLLPAQFRFEESESDYEKIMSILDFVSGMTDHFALKMYRNLRGIEMPKF